ncbi:AraC family transcriptional regulator [Cohnella soli]|uniref:Helix-turn-helix domain-containing protein n=1 Tax=Cohnella soli TaxID=425005 RepID=A0ABW0HSJ6_9BACL
MELRKYDIVHLSAEAELESGGIHPCYEILFISSGSAHLRWMGKDYRVQAPALFLLAPNTPHTLISERSSPCSFLYLELGVESAAAFPGLPQQRDWNMLQTSEERLKPGLASVYTTAHSLLETLSPQSPFAAVAEQIAQLDIRKILLLIGCYFLPASEADRLTGSRLEQPEASERIRTLMRNLESTYFEPHTVNQLAASAHLDVSYFIRQFRSITGKSPLKYLQDLRMNAAAWFLSTTQKPVQEIASATGFQSVHYFSRLFKMTYGVSPSEWRKRETRV